MINIRQALDKATQLLIDKRNETRIEAEILLAFILKKNRAYLFAYPEELLSDEQQENYFNLVKQRLQGIPIAYITQTREFWSLALKVSPDTLIPRHETELLVELVLELVPNQPHLSVLDLGTGSGAIALAIAKERPTWHVDASDYCLKALTIARENAKNHGLSNIHFYHSDWFSAIPQKQYDLIVSNPPYIDENDPHLTEGDVRFEPQTALVSQDKGLSDLRHLMTLAPHYLAPKGLLLFEHGYDQKYSVRAILNELGYEDVRCWQDILGHDRVSGGRRPN